MDTLRDDFEGQFAAVKEHHHAEHVGWEAPFGGEDWCDSYPYVRVWVTVAGQRHGFKGINLLHYDYPKEDGLLSIQSAFNAALAAPPLS